MTRDQALTIVNNLDVITAFAKGERIVHRINGRAFDCNTLVLSNFKSDRPIGYEVIIDNYKFEH
jgi:hypothetical protein